MANQNNGRKVEEITPRDVDFAKWYTDVVKKTDLVDYSSVRICNLGKHTKYIEQKIQRNRTF